MKAGDGVLSLNRNAMMQRVTGVYLYLFCSPVHVLAAPALCNKDESNRTGKILVVVVMRMMMETTKRDHDGAGHLL